jgi:hypothetical protein
MLNIKAATSNEIFYKIFLTGCEPFNHHKISKRFKFHYLLLISEQKVYLLLSQLALLEYSRADFLAFLKFVVIFRYKTKIKTLTKF